MDSLTVWDTDNKSVNLGVGLDGLIVNYIGSSGDVAAIRTNHSIIQQSGFFYFEVNIINMGDNGTVGIGFCAKTVELDKMPGWEDDSWGYYSENGDIFCCSASGRSYGPSFTTGDTVGCFLNFQHKTVFYTKNGVQLGIAFRWLEGDLYPCIGMQSQGGSVELNLGHKKFKYQAVNSDDIDDEFLKEKWNETVFKLSDQQIDRFAELTKLFEIKLNHELSSKYRAKVYFIMGEYKKALAYLTELLEIKQSDEFALRYQGEIYYIEEDYNQSFKDLNKLLGINSNNTWVLKALDEVDRKKELEREHERERRSRERRLQEHDDFEELRQRQRSQDSSFLERRRRRTWRNICISRLEAAFDTWTSGDKIVDNFIRKKQLKASFYTDVIEWIPFDKFKEFKSLAKGGFGTVYTAIWVDGYITYWNSSNEGWKRFDKNKMYCLKSLYNSTKDVKKFLREIENQLKLRGKRAISIYGITKGPDDYMMVMKYAKEGSLRKALDEKYNELSLKDKIDNLDEIANCLAKVHSTGLVHKDLHNGNIVMQELNRPNITDFGLCKPVIQDLTSKPETEIFGVLPYVAPEVLERRNYTELSDIYSFGIIMSEVLTGYPPYHDIPHDKDLARRICLGLRPKIRCAVPQLLRELMDRCWDAIPSNRPTAEELSKTLRRYYYDSKDVSSEIYKQIEEIEKTPEYNLYISSPLNYTTHHLAVYTSKHLNFGSLPKPVNDESVSSAIASRQIEIVIPED